jgi:Holliday junction resolvase
MTTENTREPQMGLTFEKVWALFQETDREIKETGRELKEIGCELRETARELREAIGESIKEADRRQKETDRQFKETDRKIGKLGNRVGELVEHLMSPNILEKFRKRGFSFGKASPNVVFTDSHNNTIAEVDILLENGDVALAVEVKTKLTTENVMDHIERMEKLRSYADGHGDSRRLIGAVAGAIISVEAKPFAIKNGFYVIEQTGDTAVISVPDDFVPKE